MNKVSQASGYMRKVLKQKGAPEQFKFSCTTLDHTNSTRSARKGHRMRTVITVADKQGGVVAEAEAKVSTLDTPSAERGCEIALGRALKQLRNEGYL